MKNSFIAQGWLVLAFALGFGGALAAVEVSLREQIRLNKENETYEQIPALVRITDPETGAEIAADRTRTVQYVTDDDKVAYKAFSSEDRHIGWVIRGAGQGFADKIELLIGLDAGARTITGLYVLDQKETPNLGNKIEESWWQAQFAGRSTLQPVTYTKATPTGNEIAAVTGATISSESVCNIVNRAVKEFRESLGKLKQKE